MCATASASCCPKEYRLCKASDIFSGETTRILMRCERESIVPNILSG